MAITTAQFSELYDRLKRECLNGETIDAAVHGIAFDLFERLYSSPKELGLEWLQSCTISKKVGSDGKDNYLCTLKGMDRSKQQLICFIGGESLGVMFGQIVLDVCLGQLQWRDATNNAAKKSITDQLAGGD